jgi:8-oxo-(d)GTP phosphatase
MKIFVNDILLDIFQSGKALKQGIQLKIASSNDLMRLYDDIKAGKINQLTTPVYRIETEHYDKVIREWVNRFEVIHAAGGIVRKGDKTLFIKRLGKWDLPKGKIEAKEKKKIAAIREVEEECGVKAALVEKVGKTWHTYIQNSDKLKCTHWYLMNCLDDTLMKAQTEEQITEVRWLSASEAAEAMKNTYKSIDMIYRKFQKQKKNSLSLK